MGPMDRHEDARNQEWRDIAMGTQRNPGWEQMDLDTVCGPEVTWSKGGGVHGWGNRGPGQGPYSEQRAICIRKQEMTMIMKIIIIIATGVSICVCIV